MIASLFVLLSAPSLQLSDFAPLAFESQIMRGWTVTAVTVGRTINLPYKIAAHWWAQGNQGAIQTVDVHILVQPEGANAKQALVKWSSSGSAGSFDLEKTPGGYYGDIPVTRGCVIRAADDNVAAMATVSGGVLDKAAVAVATRLADEALALGEGFVHGKRAKARSIASRGAGIPSFDPNLQLVSAGVEPIFISRFGDMSPNFRSNTPNDPHFPATRYSWEYAGKNAYPITDSRIIVFGDAALATQVAECLPGKLFGDCPHGRGGVMLDARTLKEIPDTSPNERGPLFHSSAHWGYVARSGQAVLSCEYLLSGFKPDSSTDQAFAEQAKQTLALAGR